MIRFVTGIDTGIGKSIVTGLMARWIALRGDSVITQKIVQTGSTDMPDDIITHRRLMNIPLLEEDHRGLTCPYVFPFAGSPHLAADLAGEKINPRTITLATDELANRYDHVIIEGAGGLQVPLNDTMTILDYLAERRYPTLLVTTPRLGSINHTLMSLELLQNRNIPLIGLVYNRFGEEDTEIGNDSRSVFENTLAQHHGRAEIVDLGALDTRADPESSLGPLFSE